MEHCYRQLAPTCLSAKRVGAPSTPRGQHHCFLFITDLSSSSTKPALRVLHPSCPMEIAQHSWWLHQEDHICCDARDLTLRSSQPLATLPSLPCFGSLPQAAAHLHYHHQPASPFISHPSFHLLSPKSSQDVLLYLLSCKIYAK